MITYRFALFLRLGTGAASAAVALRMPGMTKLRSCAVRYVKHQVGTTLRGPNALHVTFTPR
jgi:hypothetical protein